MTIPEDYKEFLNWFKYKTEIQWSKISKSDENYWLKDAKWIGLTKEEITSIENQYQICFNHEHKEFLKVLHAVDKKRPTQFYNEKDEIYIKDEPYFYNWLTDDDEINHRFEWPYVQILHDVKKGFWLTSWGKRPKSELEIEKIFNKWYKEAPKLIPIFGHRFVVNTIKNVENPVLSVWGSDTIIYGWNIKHYLLHELGGQLEELSRQVFDEEDKVWYYEPIQELEEFNHNMWKLSEQNIIPYWSEIIQVN